MLFQRYDDMELVIVRLVLSIYVRMLQDEKK